MASRGVAPASFQRVNHSSCSLNSSFSIKNLLNLPEDSLQDRPQSSNVVSAPLVNGPVSLPLVPRAVRPLTSGQEMFSGGSPFNLFNLRDFDFAHHFHPWGVAAPLGEHGYSFGINIFHRKRRRPMRKKKQRPLFSPHQIQTMEEEFSKQRYVTEQKRAQLASEVNLTETQVKTWFQNRRTKWRKENRDDRNTESKMETKTSSQDGVGQILLGSQVNSVDQNSPYMSAVQPFIYMPHLTCPATISNQFSMSLSNA